MNLDDRIDNFLRSIKDPKKLTITYSLDFLSENYQLDYEGKNILFRSTDEGCFISFEEEVTSITPDSFFSFKGIFNRLHYSAITSR